MDNPMFSIIIVEVHYKKGSAEFLKIMEALSRHGFKIAPLYLHPTSNRHHLLAFRDKIPWWQSKMRR